MVICCVNHFDLHRSKRIPMALKYAVRTLKKSIYHLTLNILFHIQKHGLERIHMYKYMCTNTNIALFAAIQIQRHS